ncbi:hypothetical protein EZS27_010432 [termite gut metagenome]|uniref:Uncharacterized protein n=1 Tax=termite gut metagenome TaxID=433724 RepID=A0A5J4S6T6_9ZZZZ
MNAEQLHIPSIVTGIMAFTALGCFFNHFLVINQKDVFICVIIFLKRCLPTTRYF